jgi:hypothetical protein
MNTTPPTSDPGSSLSGRSKPSAQFDPGWSAILLRALRFAGFAPFQVAKQDALRCLGGGGLPHMRYVYLLQSEAFIARRYVGITSDLKRRIADHNAGKSPHTSKYVPWKLVTYVAF